MPSRRRRRGGHVNLKLISHAESVPGQRGDSGILNVRIKCRSVGTNAPANMGRHLFAGEVGVTPSPAMMEATMPRHMATWFRAPFLPRFAAGDTSDTYRGATALTRPMPTPAIVRAYTRCCSVVAVAQPPAANISVRQFQRKAPRLPSRSAAGPASNAPPAAPTNVDETTAPAPASPKPIDADMACSGALTTPR